MDDKVKILDDIHIKVHTPLLLKDTEYIGEAIQALINNKNLDYKQAFEYYDFILLYQGWCFDIPINFQKQINNLFIKEKSTVLENINKKSNVVEIIYIVSCITDNIIEELLVDCSISNGILQYAFIKKTLERNNNQLNEENIKLYAKAVLNLINCSLELFEYFIIDFAKNKNFYPVIGYAINSMSVESMHIFARNIEINEYDFRLQNVEIMTKNINSEKYEIFINEIYDIVCKRWGKVLSDILDNKEYLNDVIASSYINLIIDCLAIKYSDETELFNELGNCLESFEENLFEWYGKSSKAFVFYFVSITKIWLLSYVIKINEFDLKNHEDTFLFWRRLLESNQFIHLHYWWESENKFKVDMNNMFN